jgi:hypothetical protein
MALFGSGAARWASEEEQRPDELAVPEAAQRPHPLSQIVFHLYGFWKMQRLYLICVDFIVRCTRFDYQML